jgi:hypothetical protein
MDRPFPADSESGGMKWYPTGSIDINIPHAAESSHCSSENGCQMWASATVWT